MKRWSLVAMVAVFNVLLCGAVEAQVPEAVSEWLQEHAIPLPRTWEATSAAERLMLADLFEGQSIVGLGEGTHGTSEFMAARTLLVNAAIATGRPVTLAWESDAPSVAGLTALLDSAAGDLAGATEVFRGFPWRVEEMFPLLAAIRSSPNATLVGVDIFDLAGGLASTRVALSHRGTTLDRGLVSCHAAAAAGGDSGKAPDLESLGPPDLARLAACADLASEHLARAGASLEVVLSATTVAQRARHLAQFTDLLPFDDVRTLGEAITRWNETQAAASRSAERLAQADLPAPEAAFAKRFREPRDVARAYATAHREARADMRDAQRRLAAIVWAREAAGYEPEGRGYREAADSIGHFLDTLHEWLRRHDEREMLNVREAAMAANVLRVAEASTDGAIVGWAAHHFHVNRARGPEGGPTAGTLLSDSLGTRYLAIGMLQESGTVRAIDRVASNERQRTVVRSHRIDAPRAGSWEATLASVPHDLFLVDLRELPDSGPVAQWFGTERPIRWIGNTYDEMAPENYWWNATLADQFDVVVFVREGHATTPTRVAEERFGAGQ